MIKDLERNNLRDLDQRMTEYLTDDTIINLKNDLQSLKSENGKPLLDLVECMPRSFSQIIAQPDSRENEFIL
jgi:hypothetical protein